METNLRKWILERAEPQHNTILDLVSYKLN
jgi:hypothetical protein